MSEAKLRVVGRCNHYGDLVEPFDHVLFVYRAADARHSIVLTDEEAEEVVMKAAAEILKKRP